MSAYKYLGDYLGQSLRSSERQRALLDHYRFVGSLDYGTDAFNLAIPQLLWELRSDLGDDQTLRILLQPSLLAPMEGELELQFVTGAKALATLTFIFSGPGLVEIDRANVCIVGGLQGGLDCRADIRIPAKLNHEIAPSMLLIAIKALSSALGVDEVLGVSSAEQVAMTYAQDKIRMDYDQMWIDAGANLISDRFYSLVSEASQRPLSEITRSHRRRTRRKREIKAVLHDAIVARVRRVFGQQNQVVSAHGASADGHRPGRRQQWDQACLT